MSSGSFSRRDFGGFVVNSNLPRALRVAEPRIGRRFERGRKNKGQPEFEETIQARLIANLGQEGYDQLLAQLELEASITPQPVKRRRRRRPARQAVAA